MVYWGFLAFGGGILVEWLVAFLESRSGRQQL